MIAAVSLTRQISALNAEILHRKKELEAEVRAHRMRQVEADFIVNSLEAARDSLRWLDARRDHIAQRMFNGDVAPAGGCW